MVIPLTQSHKFKRLYRLDDSNVDKDFVYNISRSEQVLLCYVVWPTKGADAYYMSWILQKKFILYNLGIHIGNWQSTGQNCCMCRITGNCMLFNSLRKKFICKEKTSY